MQYLSMYCHNNDSCFKSMSNVLQCRDAINEVKSCKIKSEVQEDNIDSPIKIKKEVLDEQVVEYGNICVKHSVIGDTKSEELLRGGDNSTTWHCEDKNDRVEESKVRKGFIANSENSRYELPRNNIKLEPSPEGDRGPLCREDEKTAGNSAVDKTEDASEESKRKSGENPFLCEKAQTPGIHLKSNQTAKPHNCPHCPYGCYKKRDMDKHLSLHGGQKCRVCPVCGYRCLHEVPMTDHAKTHTADRPYHCPFCPYASAAKSNLQVHLKTHRCPRCPFTADRGAAVRRHVADEHAGEADQRKSYACATCGKAFRCKYYLADHQKTHGGELLRCEHCPYQTAHKVSLDKHLIRHTVREEHCCNECPKKYTSKASLDRHTAYSHLGIQVEPFRCGSCAFACASKSRLAVHERKHTEKRPFDCPRAEPKKRIASEVCEISFNTNTNPTVRAKRRVTGERLRCDKCSYETTDKSNLTRHALRHRTGREEHRCQSCPKKYKNKATLEKHTARVHLGFREVKPFRCGLCTFTCTAKSQMALHEIKHSDERPYECPQCHLKYKQRGNLIKHQQNSKHSCHLCSFTCCAIPLLAAHMKNHVAEVSPGVDTP